MKGMKLLAATCVSLTALGLMHSVYAAMALPSGWYLGGHIGANRAGNANYGSATSGTGKGVGFDLEVGYKFMAYLAAEAGYNSYASTTISAFGTNVGNDNHNSYYIAGKGIMPIVDSGFDLFAKLGLARMRSHVTSTNPTFLNANGLSLNAGSHTITGVYLAAGGDYNITPTLTTDIQWSRSKGNTTLGNYDLYAIGLSYLME